jgi:acylphosphatase
MSIVRRRVVVHGRVQGVWFRESARRRAGELGVGGWVRNRRDGAVEAELEGGAEAVEVLVAWFGRGPSGAHVERLDVEELEPSGETGFRVEG